MTEGLKPCPWCGGRAVMRQDDDPGYPFYVTFDHEGDCQIYAVPTDMFRSYASEAEAIATWNRRAEPVVAEPVAWMYHKPGGSPYIRDIPPEEAKWQFGVTPLYEHPPAPKQAQPIDDEALVEKLARALAIADGIEICSDASYRHSSYGIRARAILPIIREHLK